MSVGGVKNRNDIYRFDIFVTNSVYPVLQSKNGLLYKYIILFELLIIVILFID